MRRSTLPIGPIGNPTGFIVVQRDPKLFHVGQDFLPKLLGSAGFTGGGGGSFSSMMLKAWRSRPTQVRHAVARSRITAARLGRLTAFSIALRRLGDSGPASISRSISPKCDVATSSSVISRIVRDRPLLIAAL
jgi:hypothetical protein